MRYHVRSGNGVCGWPDEFGQTGRIYIYAAIPNETSRDVKPSSFLMIVVRVEHRKVKARDLDAPQPCPPSDIADNSRA